MAWMQDPASAKQLRFIDSLMERKQHSESLTPDERRALTKRTASVLIGRLVAAPERTAPVAAPAAPKTDPYLTRRAAEDAAPKGFYALIDPSDGSLRFYQVRKAYRRPGQQVVSLHGRPGQFGRRWMGDADAMHVLGRITADPFEAMARFAEHYAVCGRCAAELTDEASRERQFGPECWSILVKDGLVLAGTR